MYAANRIGKPEELEGWYAYCVGVDDGLLYQPLSKLGTGDEKHGLEFVPDKNQLSVLPDALKKVGWEGDGTIVYVALPPYLAADEEQRNHWFPAFFVKQSNNGYGFIAALRPLSISEANIVR